MRILLLNPNMTEAVTDRLVAAAAVAASPGTTIIPATAPRGFPYISCKAEAQIAGAIVLEMLAERQGTYDAAIVAAFGDPGLFAARELFDQPVIGMSEAAMLTACMLGKRFGIVSFAAQMEAWYAECVESHGLAHRCAGIFCLRESFASITSVAEEKTEALVALAGEAVAAGSDVVILAGAPLAGSRPTLPIASPCPSSTRRRPRSGRRRRWRGSAPARPKQAASAARPPRKHPGFRQRWRRASRTGTEPMNAATSLVRADRILEGFGPDGEPILHEDAALLIENGRVSAIGPAEAMIGRHPQASVMGGRGRS